MTDEAVAKGASTTDKTVAKGSLTADKAVAKVTSTTDKCMAKVTSTTDGWTVQRRRSPARRRHGLVWRPRPPSLGLVWHARHAHLSLSARVTAPPLAGPPGIWICRTSPLTPLLPPFSVVGQATALGALMSCLALVVMGVLFLSETLAFARTGLGTSIALDENDQPQIRLNFNITLLDLHCDYVSVDVWDTLGTNRQNVTKNVEKWQLDEQGQR